MREIIIDWQISQYVIDEVLTDEDGYFYWETEENPGEDSYGIKRIKSPLHFFNSCSNDITCGGIVEYLDQYEVIVHLDPFAYLQLQIEDVPEIESAFCRVWTDDIRYLDDFISGTFNETYVVKGNRTQKIYYKYDNIPDSSLKDSLYIAAFDTAYYKIEY